METLSAWFEQIKELPRWVWVVYAMVFGVFVVIIILREFYNVPIGFLTRDVGDVMRHNQISEFPFFQKGIVNLPFYLGAVSYIGFLLWCSTAAICFYTFTLLRKVKGRGATAPFFLLSGIFTTFLLMDDLFRFHEIVFPVYLHLPERTPYVIYIVIAVLLVVRYRRLILGSDYLLLLFALGCLGLSIATDTLTDFSHFCSRLSGMSLLEDGSKFLGIVTWFMYLARTAFQHVTEQEVKETKSPVGMPS